jgi:predicted RNA-binding Zn-ribbon protein involved in translation (DUF1610 family)
MSIGSDRPLVMQCPSCGATLAVPNADAFECDYCGQRIEIPSTHRLKKVSPHMDTSQNAQATIGQSDLQEGVPITIDSRLLQQRRMRFILFSAITAAVALMCLVIFLVLLIMRMSGSSDSAQFPQIALDILPLVIILQFARFPIILESNAD